MNKKILAILVFCSTLMAEEIWIDDIAALYYGQKILQEASLKAKKLKQDEIAKLSCLKGSEIFELEDKKLRDDCDAIFVQLKRAYYTKTPFGTKKLPKDKTKIPLSSFESVESIKKMYKNDATKLFNAPFEISLSVPLKRVKVGDRVRFLVSSFGRPKAGISITYNKKLVAKSDRYGNASIEMKQDGLQKITASYSQKADGIRCDEIVHSTTISLEVLRR
ncbi:MAG: hypothetical protein RBS11_01745 [Sulfurimonas sp.]|jgi:nickel transport protein|nr:hypothetical protein [Sulfurimonas sp.]